MKNGCFAEKAHEHECAPEEECDQQHCTTLEAGGAAVFAALLVGKHVNARNVFDAL